MTSIVLRIFLVPVKMSDAFLAMLGNGFFSTMYNALYQTKRGMWPKFCNLQKNGNQTKTIGTFFLYWWRLPCVIHDGVASTLGRQPVVD